MKPQHALTGAFAINILLLVLIAARPEPAPSDVVTVREFRLVDAANKERASIKVEDTGEVVFRLRDSAGTIRVKVGAGSDGSGFVFLDQDTNPVIHGTAGKGGGKLTVT